MLLYIHPVFQVLFTLLALYAFILGLQRFRALHLGQKTPFDRKRHLLIGRLAMVGWLCGAVGGAIMVRWFWMAWFITGAHATIAFTMLPLIMFGMITGAYMERKPAKRKILPLLHGCSNLTALLLASYQFYLGYHVINDFVLGG